MSTSTITASGVSYSERSNAAPNKHNSEKYPQMTPVLNPANIKYFYNFNLCRIL